MFFTNHNTSTKFPKEETLNHVAVNGGIIRFTLFSGDFAEKWMTPDSEKVTMGWSGLCTQIVSHVTARCSSCHLTLTPQWTIMSSPISSQDLISIQLWDCSAEISSNNGRVLNTKIMSSSSWFILIHSIEAKHNIWWKGKISLKLKDK